MTFRTELLELRRQAKITRTAEIKEFVDNTYRANKIDIENAMKTSANNGFVGAAFFIPPLVLESYSPLTRKHITECLCELLEQEYPDIKFTAYAQGEISITWEE